MTDLETLFAWADIVSIHTPLLPETRGMIGARHLSLLRDGAICSIQRVAECRRGGTPARMTSGRLLAALDVFHQEPLELDSPLRSLPECVSLATYRGPTIDTLFGKGR